MKILMLIMFTFGINAFARQLCVDVKDNPSLKYDIKETLADGSVVFKNPRALARPNQYLPLYHTGGNGPLFCGLLHMHFVQDSRGEAPPGSRNQSQEMVSIANNEMDVGANLDSKESLPVQIKIENSFWYIDELTCR